MKREKLFGGSERKVLDSILDKLEKTKKEAGSRAVLVTFEQLHELLSHEEEAVIKKALRIRPDDFGIRRKFLGVEKVPKDLVAIERQKYCWHRKTEPIATQYLTADAYASYKKMVGAMGDEIGRKLLVASGYRSPAYQTLTLLWWLRFYEYDVGRTLGRVAMPGYSEHCSVKRLAVDFITENGLPSDEHPYNFVRSREYRWLRRNAARFKFAESYPKGNSQALMWEPWHWRYEGEATS